MKKKNKPSLETPVLFLIFNRLDTTKKVFAEIRKAKPKKLFIASDGPRNNEPGEREKVEGIRRYILENIDWPCKVKTLFRDKNLGCKYAVSGAIDWFFENVKQGIILEDDCLPSQSFFVFCQTMLERYVNNLDIVHVSGTNVETITPINEDYFFSNCFNVWGWATWKRAWKKYDINMLGWKNIRFNSHFLKITTNYDLITRIRSWRLYQMTYKNEINTWDYQWDFACRLSNSKSVIPSKNLITNLGFDIGTHTTNYDKTTKTLRKFNLNHFNKNNNLTTRKEYLYKYILFFSNFKLNIF
jgi:hypothetical protein